jgi:predicted  nucleic acid-binding Zn-ribbon protein
MMSNHYRFESDQAMFVNLDAELYILKEHQQRLQQKIAKLTMDLTVITEEIVARQKHTQQ